MSELEDALTRASSDVYKAYYSASLHHETDPAHIAITDDEACEGCGKLLAEFDAALARLERLVRLDEAKRVPCMGMIGEWDCLRRATTAPTVLCDRCDRIAELEAEIAEAVK